MYKHSRSALRTRATALDKLGFRHVTCSVDIFHELWARKLKSFTFRLLSQQEMMSNGVFLLILVSAR